MSTFERFEGDLPMLLDELAPPRTPDYLDDVFGWTVGARQRPAWTFPARWLPRAVLGFAVPTVPRTLVRIVALAILVLLAVTLAGIALVGSLRSDLPSPYGVAGNGMVAYSSGNDILLLDPITGLSKPITTSSQLESQPAFSPDGTRLAFRRLEAGTAIDSYDLVVTDADGSNPRIIASLPITYWSGWETIQWAPDSRSFLVNMQSSGELRQYDAETPGEPRILAKGVTGIDFRPPRGDQILFRRLDMSGTGLFTMDADGSDERPLITIPLGETRGEEDLGSARWSPDGSRIVFTRTPAGQVDRQHLFVMNADGSDVQPLPVGGGTDSVSRLAWSPDGTRIAFERWVSGRPTIGVLTLASGEVIDVGPPLGGDGWAFEWSPDGTSILAMLTDDPRLVAIDADDGSYQTLGSGPSIEKGVLDDLRPSWQRVKAP